MKFLDGYLHTKSSAFLYEVAMFVCCAIKMGFAYMPVQTQSLVRPKEQSRFYQHYGLAINSKQLESELIKAPLEQHNLISFQKCLGTELYHCRTWRICKHWPHLPLLN